MADLLIGFAYSLKRYELREGIHERHGPHFARWLPDGQDDALSRRLSESVELRLWFRRYGEVRHSFVEFDTDKREVDPDVMRRQAVLDAGPLFGEVELTNVPEDTLTAVQEDRQGHRRYEQLGKRIVQDIIEPQVDRFLNILRRNFGQYWIRPLEPWDSRDRSLGYYCQLRSMQWSTDGGETWRPFRPTEREPLVVEGEVSLNRYGPIRVLTRDDWEGLARIWSSDYEPSFGAELLQRAHEQIRIGNPKFALLEGVTALEVAIEEFVERKIEGDGSLSSEVKSFLNLGLKPQVAVLGRSTDLVPAVDVRDTLRAIDLRHEVIHEGSQVEEEQEELVWALLNTVAELLHGPTFRFPSGTPGQALYTEESWEKIEWPELDLAAIGLTDGEENAAGEDE